MPILFQHRCLFLLWVHVSCTTWSTTLQLEVESATMVHRVVRRAACSSAGRPLSKLPFFVIRVHFLALSFCGDLVAPPASFAHARRAPMSVSVPTEVDGLPDSATQSAHEKMLCLRRAITISAVDVEGCLYVSVKGCKSHSFFYSACLLNFSKNALVLALYSTCVRRRVLFPAWLPLCGCTPLRQSSIGPR